jgi:hypothetical protein
MDLHFPHMPFCKLLMHIDVIGCDQTLEEDGKRWKEEK